MSLHDTTFELFTRASIDDGALGYPDRVAFVHQDLENVDALLKSNLRDGLPTVVVMNDQIEVLVEPEGRPRLLALLDNARDRNRVKMHWRLHALAQEYTVQTTFGAHPLRDMRSDFAARA